MTISDNPSMKDCQTTEDGRICDWRSTSNQYIGFAVDHLWTADTDEDDETLAYYAEGIVVNKYTVWFKSDRYLNVRCIKDEDIN